MAIKKDIIGADIQIGTNEAQASLSKLSKTTAELTKNNEALRIERAKMVSQGKKNSDEFKRLDSQIKENNKTIKNNKEQMQALGKTIGVTAMSANQLSKRARELKSQMNGMSKSANPQEWDRLNKELAETEGQLGKVKAGSKGVSSSLDQMGPLLGGTANGIISMTRASMAFIATPLGLILGGIALALQAVSVYFKSSEEGQNSFNKVAKVGSVILGNLTDIISDVGKFLFEAFENPQQAIADLWEALKQNIINRGEGLINMFKSIGKVIEGAFKLDWDQVNEGVLDFANAGIQTATGIEDALTKTTEALTGLIDETEREIEVAKHLAAIEAERDLKARKLIVDQEKLREQSRELRLRAEQAEAEERIRLLEEAFAVEDELARRKTEIAQMNLFLKQEENKLSLSTKEDLNEEARLEAELFIIQQQRLKMQRTLQTQINTERNKLNEGPTEAERYKQETEELQLAQEERMLALKENYANRLLSDEEFETQQLEQKALFLQEEKALLEEYGKDVNAINDSILDNRIALNNKEQQLSEQRMQQAETEKVAYKNVQEAKTGIAQDALQIIRDVTGEESAIGKAAFLLQQGIAAGQVIFNTAIANAKAAAASPYTGGLPWTAINTAAAGLSLAKIAAQSVSAFKGKKDGGFTDQASTDDEVVDFVHSNEFVANARAVRNPTVKPALDAIDLAQKNGTIDSINLPQAIGAGTTSGTTSSGTLSEPTPQGGGDMSMFMKMIVNEIRTLKETPSVAIFDYDYDQRERDKMDKLKADVAGS